MLAENFFIICIPSDSWENGWVKSIRGKQNTERGVLLMKKALILLLITLVMIPVGPGIAQQEDTMQALAQSYLPEGAIFQKQKMDDGRYELTFWVEETQEEYEVEFSADGKILLEISSEARSDRGSAQIALTTDQAQARLQTIYPDAMVDSIKLDRDDGLYEYKIAFHTSDLTGVVQMNPETGAILERKLRYNGQEGNKTVSASADDGELITIDRAQEIALEKSGGGRIVSIRLDRDDGQMIYEVEIIKDSYEYEMDIDAKSGTVISWERDRLGWNDD